MRDKDTLLKEADEYVNSIYEFGRNQNGMYTQVQVKQAYIAGKKSMQKENTELKKQVEKMKCCGNCNSMFCNREDKLKCGYNYNNWSLRI